MNVIEQEGLAEAASTSDADSSNNSRDVALRIIEHQEPQDVDSLIAIASSWMPALGNGNTFVEEMQDRVAYMQGSMYADMEELIESRYTQTSSKVKKFGMYVKLYRRIIDAKARAFYGQGNKFVLVDDDGTEIPAEEDSAANFAWMLTRGRWLTAAKQADKYVQAHTRCLVRPWWDDRSGCVQFSVWPQHLVYWVPNPEKYWSADDCYAVALAMPGRNSIGGNEHRYEVWAKVKVGNEWKTCLLRVGDEQSAIVKGDKVEKVKTYFTESINATNTIPFIDPETNEPCYPFVWWQADMNMSLYFVGDEDALTIPRQVNTGLTDLNYSMHYNANPAEYWEPTRTDVTSQPPAVAVIGPGEMVGGGDWKPAFVQSGYDGGKVLDVWNALIEAGVEMDIGTSAGVIQESGGSESGLSVQIKRQPLYEHRQDMIEVYRPFVEDTLKRAIMVWNQYAGDEYQIVGSPKWIPGDIVDVQDKEAEGRQWALKIENNTATPIDQLMYETGMSKEQAIATIEENAKLNRMLRAMSDPGSEMPDISLGDAIAKMYEEEPEEEEKPDDVTVEQVPGDDKDTSEPAE